MIRRIFLLASVVLLVTTSAIAAESVVKLVVDYGDGAAKHFDAIPFRPKMSGLDVLKAASEHPHGIKFESRGSGSTLLIDKVDDVKNEGGGMSARNWQYRVNGKLGEVSIGALEVHASDTILWKFALFEKEEEN
jgi:hypothetical protein